MVALIIEEQQKTGQPISLSSLLVLNALKHNRRMSLNEISSECNIPESKLRSTVEQLTEAEIVDGIGNGRGRVYVLSAIAYKDPIQYVRQTDIALYGIRSLFLSPHKIGSIARNDIIDLLHVSGPQAFWLFKKLETSGKLIRNGNTSAAKYSLPNEHRLA